MARVKYRELRAVGIDVDFDPVMDVNSNPQNPVIGVWQSPCSLLFADQHRSSSPKPTKDPDVPLAMPVHWTA